MQPVRHDTLNIPVFEEGRLRYRATRPDDFKTYAEFRMSERAKGVGGPSTEDGAHANFIGINGHWAMHGFGRWLIADRDTDEPLGVVGPLFVPSWPELEIAWSVFNNAEGRGVAYEAAQFTRRYAYEVLGWTTAISCTMVDNTRSIALAKRMGCTQDPDFDHPELGLMNIWRHPGPEALK